MASTHDKPGSAQSDLAGKAAADAERLKEAAQEKAKTTLDAAKAQADENITATGESIRELTDVIDAAAESLSEKDREGLARYARQLSGSIGTLADDLQSKSIEQLTEDVKTLARNNPNGFLLGSIAVGFGLSRFVKATHHRTETSHVGEPGSVPGNPSGSASGYASGSPSSNAPTSQPLGGSPGRPAAAPRAPYPPVDPYEEGSR
jgi:hypothetical protein